MHIINASGNLIGGTADGSRNVISGNAGNGIRIEGGAPLPSLVGSWQADGDATDSVGNNDGQIVGAGFTTGVHGGHRDGNVLQGNIIGLNAARHRRDTQPQRWREHLRQLP